MKINEFVDLVWNVLNFSTKSENEIYDIETEILCLELLGMKRP